MITVRDFDVREFDIKDFTAKYTWYIIYYDL